MLCVFTFNFSHVVFAPSVHNGYAGTSLPGVSDALYDAMNASGEDAEDEEALWKQVNQQVSVVTYVIHAAAKTLCKPSHL